MNSHQRRKARRKRYGNGLLGAIFRPKKSYTINESNVTTKDLEEMIDEIRKKPIVVASLDEPTIHYLQPQKFKRQQFNEQKQ